MTVPPKITATKTIPEHPTSHQPTDLLALLTDSDAFEQNLVIASRSGGVRGRNKKMFFCKKDENKTEYHLTNSRLTRFLAGVTNCCRCSEEAKVLVDSLGFLQNSLAFLVKHLEIAKGANMTKFR